ncbi:MAG: Hsp20/alpha crystallin family protein [Candidatus Saccharicenans sp.]|jgi:HSP20 family protein|uniref:Small heat shock protein n=1 Tax=Candidatus Saccharicenans subterraneus TaxID=2508984 RepID=A0A3E2BQJ3_9BACT|nr:Hsp20/alpha crystallin family protein [Candidatus Saccharicenans sp.]MDH7574841.1 Hsp20/alpha crystallin family protein [Candidatus Saccharicenans sp.]NPV82514.1 Hsp20/alpha crystallin family protein [Candidatus Aminicenantes bacterium]RFT16984.1 MAG: Small heat shock protein [Candidatus Saccharicenans subterraneum]
MAITKWDPFRDIMVLRDRMNRLFEDLVSSPKFEESDIIQSTWSPAVDIYETENELVLTAELPGVEEKDVEIKVEDNTLSLRGERKFEKETREENYHRIERAYGSFYRSFSLPNYVDQEKISAEYENGLLKVHMPKKPEVKPRKVKIVKPQTAEKSGEKATK